MIIQSIINSGNIISSIEKLDRVTEVAFADFAKNKAVKEVFIIQTEEGRYILLTYLSWKDSLSVIETARGDIKEWASDSRLAKHLKEKLPAIPNLELILNEKYFKNSFDGLLKQVHLNTNFRQNIK
jgi:hypothetical protein|tara:strand:- start:28959 stop:29336 length:378 start_codon:yes stop_codon:yes gene_type:complete